MKFYRKILLLIFVCACSINAHAQTPSRTFFDKEINPIFEAIYEYQFFHADSLIAQYKEKHPSSIWNSLLTTNILWWKIMTGEKTPEVVKAFNANISRQIQVTDKHKNNISNEELYIISNTYAFKTRLNLLEGENIKGLVNLNNCIGYIEKSLGKEEKYDPFLITSGLLTYFIEFSSKNHPITRPYLMTLPDGSMVKGIKMLETASKLTDNIMYTEGNYFLGKIYQEVEKNYALGEKYNGFLVNLYPKNILYQFNYFDCLLNQGKKDEAMKVLVKMNVLSKTSHQISILQKQHFLNEAQKKLQAYYKKIDKK